MTQWFFVNLASNFAAMVLYGLVVAIAKRIWR